MRPCATNLNTEKKLAGPFHAIIGKIEAGIFQIVKK